MSLATSKKKPQEAEKLHNTIIQYKIVLRHKQSKEWSLEALHYTLHAEHSLCCYIIIIIIAHRQQWSIATTLHDVHVPLRSATSVSSWPVFRRRSAVSMSSEDVQRVYTSSCWTVTGFRCIDLFQYLMCRCGGVQSDDVTEQCMTSLVNYISNVWQHGTYINVLHMVLPISGAGIPCGRTVTCAYRLPTGCMCQNRTAASEECRSDRVAAWCPGSVSVVTSSAASNA